MATLVECQYEPKLYLLVAKDEAQTQSEKQQLRDKDQHLCVNAV